MIKLFLILAFALVLIFIFYLMYSISNEKQQKIEKFDREETEVNEETEEKEEMTLIKIRDIVPSSILQWRENWVVDEDNYNRDDTTSTPQPLNVYCLDKRFDFTRPSADLPDIVRDVLQSNARYTTTTYNICHLLLLSAFFDEDPIEIGEDDRSPPAPQSLLFVNYMKNFEALAYHDNIIDLIHDDNLIQKYFGHIIYMDEDEPEFINLMKRDSGRGVNDLIDPSNKTLFLTQREDTDMFTKQISTYQDLLNAYKEDYTYILRLKDNPDNNIGITAIILCVIHPNPLQTLYTQEDLIAIDDDFEEDEDPSRRYCQWFIYYDGFLSKPKEGQRYIDFDNPCDILTHADKCGLSYSKIINQLIDMYHDIAQTQDFEMYDDNKRDIGRKFMLYQSHFMVGDDEKLYLIGNTVNNRIYKKQKSSKSYQDMVKYNIVKETFQLVNIIGDKRFSFRDNPDNGFIPLI